MGLRKWTRTGKRQLNANPRQASNACPHPPCLRPSCPPPPITQSRRCCGAHGLRERSCGRPGVEEGGRRAPRCAGAADRGSCPRRTAVCEDKPPAPTSGPASAVCRKLTHPSTRAGPTRGESQRGRYPVTDPLGGLPLVSVGSELGLQDGHECGPISKILGTRLMLNNS